MKKILITGGAGFIGTNLISHLNENYKNLEIAIIDNQSLGKRSDIDCKYKKFYDADISEEKTFKALDIDFDTVIHLAASTRVLESIEQPNLMLENNIIGTFYLLEFCRVNNIRNVVIASTGGAIIGDTSKIISEESLPMPISPYGASKLSVEAFSNSYNVSYDMNISCLRFSNVYGPRSKKKKSVIATFFKKILNQEKLFVYGDGLQERDYIFVEDVIKAIDLCIEKQASGVFQIATGESTNIKTIIEIMKELTELRFNSEIIYSDIKKGEVYKTSFSTIKAMEQINFKARIGLREGLEKTWKWFREN